MSDSDLLTVASERGADVARLRRLFDAATAEYLGWGALPEGERTESRRVELDGRRRAADVELANAVARSQEPLDGLPRRRGSEDIVREAGGTVL